MIRRRNKRGIRSEVVDMGKHLIRLCVVSYLLPSLVSTLIAQSNYWQPTGAQPAIELKAQFDVFPLAPRFHYKYHVERYSYYQFVSFVEIVADSGTVEYVILDSTSVNDTTAHWSVLQIRGLMHRYHSSSRDSLFFISDSSMVVLVETTTGYHELRCSAYAWNFPLSLVGLIPVLRYSDSFQTVASYTYPTPTCGSMYDSAWFSADSGFNKRKEAKCWRGGLTESNESLSLHLLSSPTVFVAESVGITMMANESYLLSQNYPNPFNPTTTIEFQIPRQTDGGQASTSLVTLKVFDLLGREVATLVNEEMKPGSYKKEFSASGGSASGAVGNGLASGVYFYQIRAGAFVQTRKLLLLR